MGTSPRAVVMSVPAGKHDRRSNAHTQIQDPTTSMLAVCAYRDASRYASRISVRAITAARVSPPSKRPFTAATMRRATSCGFAPSRTPRNSSRRIAASASADSGRCWAVMACVTRCRMTSTAVGRIRAAAASAYSPAMVSGICAPRIRGSVSTVAAIAAAAAAIVSSRVWVDRSSSSVRVASTAAATAAMRARRMGVGHRPDWAAVATIWSAAACQRGSTRVHAVSHRVVVARTMSSACRPTVARRRCRMRMARAVTATRHRPSPV